MSALPKSQLLIVDDYPTNIKVLSDLLMEYGFEVLIARDGENALHKLQRISPDLILLDVLMPGIDGFETCRRLKEQPSTRDIPVIFMTALADPVDKIKGLTLGAVDYITKPFQQEEVLARVNTHLKLRHLAKQLAEQNAQLQEEARSRQLAEMALRVSEEKFSKAFRSNPCPMMIASLDQGRILEINQMFCHHLGYPPETVLNQQISDFSLFAQATDRDQLLAILREQKAVRHFECALHTHTGERRWFLISAEVIQVHNQPCMLTMMLDITECKQAALAMQQAKAAAELANQTKTQFLSNITHELRTPLNTILGYTQLMERNTTGVGELQSHLSIISRSGQHLLTLINDVLEMTKIESGRVALNPTPFKLTKLLHSLYEMLSPRAQAKGLQLIFETAPNLPTYLWADEVKLRQILVNLLGNSIKFTDQGRVLLRIRRVEGTGEARRREGHRDQTVVLRFEVQDTGSGIEKADLERLFDPFIQTEAGRRTQEGTGLGLPISQRFVQLMGGEIAVESTVDLGSTFRFEIPVRLAQAGELPPEKPQQRVMALAANQPTTRILVVEDQITNRQLLVRLLTTVGFEVQEAVNGEAAIAQYQRWQPHLILMDVRMPVMDGYEATRRIREYERARETATEPEIERAGEPLDASHPDGADAETPVASTKIIILTANAFEEERQAAFTAGCDGFLRKPIQESVLFDCLAEQLGVSYVYQAIQTSPVEPVVAPWPTTETASFPRLSDAVLADLADLADGDNDFLREYLTLHLEQFTHLVQSLHQAIQDQDAKQLCLAAHTLKGIGMTFEAERVIELCLFIEKMATEGITTIPQLFLTKLDTALGQLIAAIRQTLEQVP